MSYVLEWRDAQSSAGRPPTIVSYVRVFRTAAAIKAFVASRAFATTRNAELRLTLRPAGRAQASVITSVALIRAWDNLGSLLPDAALGSAWAAELERMSSAANICARIETELTTAERAGLLTGRQANWLRLQVRRLLNNPD
jgi:hypothetical protein